MKKLKNCQPSLLEANEVSKLRKEFLKHEKQIIKITEYSKALSDTTRSKILSLLLLFESLCVCDIANILEISIASTSGHLRKLHDQQLITSQKRGQTVFYELIAGSGFKDFCIKSLNF
jgi:DNA-binding transcriptional ArsR family regulator